MNLGLIGHASHHVSFIEITDLDGHAGDLSDDASLDNDKDVLIDGLEPSQATQNIYDQVAILYEGSKNGLIRSENAKVKAEKSLSSGEQAVDNIQEYDQAKEGWEGYSPY